MTMIKPTLLILAAGMGSRYGGLKQIDPIGPNGEAIIDYSIYDAIQAGFGKLVFIIRPDIEAVFRETLGQKYEAHLPVAYVHQTLDLLPAGYTVPSERQKPWGTGHAVLVAEAAINEPFAVINADDFYGASAYKVMHAHLTQSAADYALVGFVLRNTLSDYGTVSRGICEVDAQGYIKSVTEITKIEKDGQQARYVDEAGQTQILSGDELVSMNLWGFTPAIFAQLRDLFGEFLQKRGHEPKAEFYIPYAVNHLIAQQQAQAKILTSHDSWFGMTYQEDKPYVTRSIQALVEQGQYPQQLIFTTNLARQ